MYIGFAPEKACTICKYTIQLAFLALVVCSSIPRSVQGQEYEYSLFERAKNAYDRGEYAEAVSRFEAILKSDLKNPALVLECHKLLAVSFLFTGDVEAAEKHFSELLTLEPDYVLDPMLFPIEVIDFFLEVKAKSDKRLEELKLARAREEEKRREEEAIRRAAELESLKRNVYLERERKQNSILVAMMPYGAGQFQNGHVGKGVFFLTGELLLTSAVVSTYFLHEALRDSAEDPIADSNDRNDLEREETIYRVTNQASAIALAAVAVWGIVDSLFNYEPETITWNELEEREVPDKLRPGKKNTSELFLAPCFGDRMIGVGAGGRF